MPESSPIVSVRLDRDTLHRLELAAAEYNRLAIKTNGTAYYPPYNRSMMIRHAIRTGLDVLNHEPVLEL